LFDFAFRFNTCEKVIQASDSMKRLKRTKQSKANAKIKEKQAKRANRKELLLIDGAQRVFACVCEQMLISDAKNAVADLENR
jgi:hypothetical protein